MSQALKKSLLLITLIGLLSVAGCSYGRSIDTSEVYTTDLKDGFYTVESATYDSFGYKRKITLGVVDGFITQVNFTEIDKAGKDRNDEEVHWADCEYSLSQLIQKLYDETILSQAEEFDTITGATKTCKDYEILVDEALKNATEGAPSQEIVDNFTDTFVVRNEIDPLTGSQEEMTVVIVNGIPSSINVSQVNSNPRSYLINRNYTQLAEQSTLNHSLDDLTSADTDLNTLTRYNKLLEQIRTLRN